MSKLQIGIFGLKRGSSFIDSILGNDGEIVAVCDFDSSVLTEVKTNLNETVGIYTDFDKFIQHPMDAVLIANYFCEHTKYAVACLEKDIHVLCECVSNATMAEGVKLVKAAQKSNAYFMLAENYPFMLFNQEMKKVYDSGTLGQIMYAEGEYNHPLDWYDGDTVVSIRPFEKHWRNFLPRSYYITHSLAPLMYATGSKPVRVCAMPVYMPLADDCTSASFVADQAAIIMCMNDDNSVFKVTGCAAFGAHGNSYRLCCTKGQIENIRGMSEKVMLRYNSWDIPEGKDEINFYEPAFTDEDTELISKAGHGGGDFFVIRKFFECVRKNIKPEFDEYFATCLSSVAILSHRSILNAGFPFEIPDFRNEEDCKKYENDYLSPFWYSDGTAPTIPCCSNPDYKPTEKQLENYRNAVNKKSEK